ncbi:MAG TPA: coenzyme F420-0:L-glutamate ligase [Solirubrobacterales bacterium]|nr:coenzyme F420-0:L-glutamate ligase [Solirubrobacterales bacterium]
MLIGDAGEISIRPVPGIPEVTEGFNLGAAICDGIDVTGDDILVISQKVVSKAEGRIVDLGDVTAGSEATALATELGKDPRLVELILGESRSIVRKDGPRGILITETVHGFICANAGIDTSNLDGSDTVVLLPRDSDRSARRIRGEIEAEIGARPAVIVSDSFGRAWRHGQSEVAVGCAGIDPLDDWRGLPDRSGMILAATNIAVVDEIAAAADLARTKTSGTPAICVRGLKRFVQLDDGSGCQTQLREAEDDLFR